jgi:two-component system LytT family response regulator
VTEEQRLRVLLVDDEPMARAGLRRLVASDGELELVGECANGVEALAFLEERGADLVLLDVDMPGMDGFELLEALTAERRPAIVFTTAYDRFALRAFDVHAVDYLLKPFDDERFEQAVERVKERLRGGTPEAPQGDEPPEEPLERFVIHREGHVEVIDPGDVEWIEAADQYVRLHAADGEHLMRESMARLEQRLDPGRFLRVHRSAIVALDRVRRLETRAGGAGRLLLAGGAWVPVSRSRVAAVRRRLG